MPVSIIFYLSRIIYKREVLFNAINKRSTYSSRNIVYRWGHIDFDMNRLSYSCMHARTHRALIRYRDMNRLSYSCMHARTAIASCAAGRGIQSRQLSHSAHSIEYRVVLRGFVDRNVTLDLNLQNCR